MFTDELQRQLKLIDCKAIISSKQSYNNIKEALNALQTSIPIILIDNDELPEGTIKFAELAEDFNIDISCLKSVQRTAKDLAILPFSSGTTGFPKAVALTHGSVVAMNEMIADPSIIVIKETTGKYSLINLFDFFNPSLFFSPAEVTYRGYMPYSHES